MNDFVDYEVFHDGERVYLRPYKEWPDNLKYMLSIVEYFPREAIVDGVFFDKLKTFKTTPIIMLKHSLYLYDAQLLTHMPSCPICRKYPFNKRKEWYEYQYGRRSNEK